MTTKQKKKPEIKPKAKPAAKRPAMAKKKTADQLTVKDSLFINEYLIDFNATQAYIRAGFGTKSACTLASRLLRKVHIQEEIKKRVDAILSDSKGLALRVVRECEKIAFAKLDDFVEFDDAGVIIRSSKTIDTAALESVQFDTTFTATGGSIKKKVKQHDKLKALEILAKYTELYKESDVNINNNTVVYLDKQDEAL